MRKAPAVLFAALLAAPAARGAPPDYAPLALYAGTWTVTLHGAKGEASTLSLANACARVGVNFACQQSVEGTPGVMLVFLPGKEPGAWLTQTLTAGGRASGEPGRLAIDGPVWTFTSRETTGAGSTWTRNVNTFRDADHIHFAISTSTDGQTWTPGLSGDETRR